MNYKELVKDVTVTTLIAACRMVLIILLIAGTQDSNGIVGLENFPQGVALCQGDGKSAPLTKIKGGYIYKKDGIFYTVNTGYLESPQVKELETLAKKVCNALKEKNNVN